MRELIGGQGRRSAVRCGHSGRWYRGGYDVCLAIAALDRGYADPRWGGHRQIQEAGGRVSEGEKGTPVMYVDWRQRPAACGDTRQPGVRRGKDSSGLKR